MIELQGLHDMSNLADSERFPIAVEEQVQAPLINAGSLRQFAWRHVFVDRLICDRLHEFRSTIDWHGRSSLGFDIHPYDAARSVGVPPRRAADSYMNNSCEKTTASAPFLLVSDSVVMANYNIIFCEVAPHLCRAAYEKPSEEVRFEPVSPQMDPWDVIPVAEHTPRSPCQA